MQHVKRKTTNTFSNPAVEAKANRFRAEGVQKADTSEKHQLTSAEALAINATKAVATKADAAKAAAAKAAADKAAEEAAHTTSTQVFETRDRHATEDAEIRDLEKRKRQRHTKKKMRHIMQQMFSLKQPH